MIAERRRSSVTKIFSSPFIHIQLEASTALASMTAVRASKQVTVRMSVPGIIGGLLIQITG
jgi:hypothetical protein